MGVGMRIKEVLRLKSLTIKQLSEISGVSLNTLYSITKRDSERVDGVLLQRIAAALGVPTAELLGQNRASSEAWNIALDQKLAAVGYSVGFYEDEAVLWINYPDGTLEVTEDDLRALNDSVDSYLRFKLAELKDAHKDCFKPKK